MDDLPIFESIVIAAKPQVNEQHRSDRLVTDPPSASRTSLPFPD
ncbi:MAG TPA: hypothetical protein VFV14_03225 [Myxococcaceae bacterium]|nr:hypothetical protein [Myxococcaceae bacterium]